MKKDERVNFIVAEILDSARLASIRPAVRLNEIYQLQVKKYAEQIERILCNDEAAFLLQVRRLLKGLGLISRNSIKIPDRNIRRVLYRSLEKVESLVSSSRTNRNEMALKVIGIIDKMVGRETGMLEIYFVNKLRKAKKKISENADYVHVFSRWCNRYLYQDDVPKHKRDEVLTTGVLFLAKYFASALSQSESTDNIEPLQADLFEKETGKRITLEKLIANSSVIAGQVVMERTVRRHLDDAGWYGEKS